MPNYTYLNTESGETFDLSMTIAEMTQYEKDNPKMERVYSKVHVADPVNIGVKKPPSDFQKYVLGRINASVPGAKVGNKRWQIPKEV